jgi:hypothetical protein
MVSKWVKKGDIFFFLAARTLRARADGVDHAARLLLRSYNKFT